MTKKRCYLAFSLILFPSLLYLLIKLRILTGHSLEPFFWHITTYSNYHSLQIRSWGILKHVNSFNLLEVLSMKMSLSAKIDNKVTWVNRLNLAHLRELFYDQINTISHIAIHHLNVLSHAI